MLRAVAFDFGHTLMDERKDRVLPLGLRPISLMPGLPRILSRIPLPMAIWANTRVDGEATIREWLTRAGIAEHFRWVITSVDAGARKPAAGFFSYALSRCALGREEVLFVGNQVNTDIQGAIEYGIQFVWLSGSAYRSPDDLGDGKVFLGKVRPPYVIETLKELPPLVERFREDCASNGSFRQCY